MATSGSYDFTVTRDQIINMAMEKAGVKGIGTVLDNEKLTTASRLLNMLVKQWQGKADFAPGLKIWARQRAFFFPQLATTEYTLGPGGDHLTASYNSTTLSAAEAAGQTVLSVTSTSNMVANDNIGIRLDSGTIHWTTISSIGVGEVTVATQLPTAASSGNTVYFYTTKAPMPLHIISLRRKDTDNNETPIDQISIEEYEEGILDKAEDGDPTRYLYERGISNGKLFLDYRVLDTTEIYLITYLRGIQDMDAAGNDMDYPQEWYRALYMQLAIDCASHYGRPVSEDLMNTRNEALAIAQNVDPDTSQMYFQVES